MLEVTAVANGQMVTLVLTVEEARIVAEALRGVRTATDVSAASLRVVAALASYVETRREMSREQASGMGR